MLIRSEQMDAQADASVDSFESKMVTHLNKCFPAECAQLQEAGVHETIRYGIERARTYGITLARDVCRYIDLMMVFGRDFDVDFDQPWAAPILTGKRWKDPTIKMDQLYRAAKEQGKQGVSNG